MISKLELSSNDYILLSWKLISPNSQVYKHSSYKNLGRYTTSFLCKHGVGQASGDPYINEIITKLKVKLIIHYQLILVLHFTHNGNILIHESGAIPCEA